MCLFLAFCSFFANQTHFLEISFPLLSNNWKYELKIIIHEKSCYMKNSFLGKWFSTLTNTPLKSEKKLTQKLKLEYGPFIL